MINTETKRVEFEDGTWVPLVGGAVIIEGEGFEFDTLGEAEDFAAAFGGVAFPVVSLRG